MDDLSKPTEVLGRRYWRHPRCMGRSMRDECGVQSDCSVRCACIGCACYALRAKRPEHCAEGSVGCRCAWIEMWELVDSLEGAWWGKRGARDLGTKRLA
ncbi:hypothetical protein HBH74_205180 [Parastagonospora nodorum]|nr:hypothetical protein HBI06_223060 [Parastagonospora nodorum]KAH4226204.1 hypothetical protein HBI05_224730 [Parastagonospora nodorum]KAH4892715.1 hypothetical protein HBH74_205180 [Parastagonospora nodorum]KAH5089703.1 hypothetical protein HBH72_225970 [Parastagonospora nodorum]KAH5590314.1 hypothetical protein HBI45_214990 [Parastagonospora nodorum]